MTEDQIQDNASDTPIASNQDKVVLLVICFLLISAVAGELINNYYFHNPTLGSIITYAGGLGGLWAIVLLIKDGTIMQSPPYFQIICFLSGILMIGILFKIQHWPGAGPILATALLGIPLIYAARFILKKNKKLLDLLKFLWVTVLFTGVTLKILHLPYAGTVLTFENILFVILFVHFTYTNIRPEE